MKGKIVGLGLSLMAALMSAEVMALTPRVEPLTEGSRLVDSTEVVVMQAGIRRVADSQGYVKVEINQPYELEISSPLYDSAVDVRIDGVEVMRGLVCDRRVRLQRPQGIAKQFVVLAEGDPGLDSAGGRNNPQLGLIEVTFRPIRRKVVPLARIQGIAPAPPASLGSSADRAVNSAAKSEGIAVGTGLGQNSAQRFQATNEWEDAPDLAQTRIRTYRLKGIPPMTLHTMPKEPMPISDPVPPRL